MNWIKAGSCAYNLDTIEEVEPRISWDYRTNTGQRVAAMHLVFIGGTDGPVYIDLYEEEATEFLIGFEAVTGIRLKLPEVP